MKKLLLSASLVFGIILCATAQSGYYNLNFLSSPGNPGGINTDVDFILTNNFAPPSGTTKLLGDDRNMPKYSAIQTLPFAFNFNGGPVTKFRASSAGFLTFSTSSALNTHTPAALPTATLPDSSVCVWGLCTAGLGLSGEVYTKVYGMAPHRQLWTVWFAATNPVDTSSIAFWAIVLEESTNNIYLVDESSTYYWNNVSSYTQANLTLGIQVTPALAYQIAGSPNVHSLVTNNGSGTNTLNDYYEFTPGTQPSFDLAGMSTNISNAIYYGIGVPYTVQGNFANAGSTAISSFTLNWSVDGGAPNSNAATVSIAPPNPIAMGTATSTINWTPATPGTHSMKIWATLLNGSNTDQNHSNDTIYVNGINVIDTVAVKKVAFEEFNQASCDPCAMATPNLDSVLGNNVNGCNAVRYHVNWPGQDFMNQETQTPFVGARVSYYSISGVPDAKMDGTIDVYPGSVSSTDIQNEEMIGSPLKITITNSTYSTGTRTFSFAANIHSYAAMPAGMKALVYVTVDTITYAANQSTETIPQYVFPQVAEDMLPNSSGTTLAAFTAGSNQTVNVSWIKNHPWGASENTWGYDSTKCHLTIFIQAANKYIYQSATAVATPILGLENLSHGVSFQMYPNPATDQTNLVFKLDQSQQVNVQIYNMLGEKVYASDNGTMSAGEHVITIGTSAFSSGIYLVKFNTDNAATVRKLIIQK